MDDSRQKPALKVHERRTRSVSAAAACRVTMLDRDGRWEQRPAAVQHWAAMDISGAGLAPPR
jgi:hypothetical protein